MGCHAQERLAGTGPGTVAGDDRVQERSGRGGWGQEGGVSWFVLDFGVLGGDRGAVKANTGGLSPKPPVPPAILHGLFTTPIPESPVWRHES